MRFSEAVKWWEEWQLRVLVLASLFLQYFLFAAAPLRKRCIPGWLRFLTWIAYLGSDAVAIYALATLFNRHKMEDRVSTHRSSVGVEALWAPVLLTHLGGQDGITAYNIEDNELWRRHVLTAFSQITVAIYVFHKSWSGNKVLLIVAIFIFVPGIMKCLEKPWTLKRANIVNSAAGSWFEYDHTRMNMDDNVMNSLEEYVDAAAKRVQYQGESLERYAREGKPNNLFVDLVPPYSVRLETLKFMVRLGKPRAHLRLRGALSRMFDRLFTWQAARAGECSCRNLGIYSPRIVFAYATCMAIPMLVWSSKDYTYNDTDVKITYALLCCTAALELVGPGIKSFLKFCVYIGDGLWLPWPDRAAQYSLIGYLDRNRRHRRLRRLASLLLCKDHLDQLWCMAPCESAGAITELVYDHVTDGWVSYIRSAGTYRRFNDFRGQWTLRRERCTRGLTEASLRRPFDESVLVWHLATDLCFHVHEHDNAAGVSGGGEAAGHSRAISNYLVYLLFVYPEMLMAGARRSLFRDAYKELRDMALEEPDGEAPSPQPRANMVPQLRERKLAGEIMAKGSDGSATGFVHDAWALARELMDIGKLEVEEEPEGGNGKKMWRVIQGVWVEMLCFSASRCRGYLHAKSLGKGGEYLSYVWLLLSYMGLEPLAEKLQRTTAELQDETDNGFVTGHATTNGED